MQKLLSANFARLRKDRFFWCLLAVVIAASLVSILNSARSFQLMTERGFGVTLEDYYFNQAPVMGIFCALFASLFLGTEYSDGTIRNKLAVGHKRYHVYLSNSLVCLAASLTFLAAWLITCSLGFFLIGPMEMGISGYAAYVLIAVGFTASFTTLFTLVGSLSSNKAMTLIYTLTIFFVLLLAGSAIYDRLCEPEMQGGMVYLNGELTLLDPTPNPLYLSGAVRRVWEWILDFLPTGQAILMNETAIAHPLRELICSVLFTGLTLFAGCAAFRWKDIK